MMLYCQYCGRSLPNTSAVCECQIKLEPVGDGGPAFARAATIWHTPDGRQTGIDAQTGMSLRDYFAGQAVGGLLAHPKCGMVGPGYEECNLCVAREAYTIADAMLAERAKRGKRWTT